MNQAGYTYEEIGEELGISRQRAHQLVNGPLEAAPQVRLILTVND